MYIRYVSRKDNDALMGSTRLHHYVTMWYRLMACLSGRVIRSTRDKSCYIERRQRVLYCISFAGGLYPLYRISVSLLFSRNTGVGVDEVHESLVFVDERSQSKEAAFFWLREARRSSFPLPLNASSVDSWYAKTHRGDQPAK